MTPEQTLELVKAYRPPKKTPEIAKLAWALYEGGGFKLDDAACEKIRAALREKFGDLKELTDELCGLAAFIVVLMEMRKDPVAAEQAANLIKETRSAYAELGALLAPLLQDAATKATGQLEKFTDTEDAAKNKAPMFGADAPDGALPLSQIKPAARPPPRPLKPPPKPAAKKAGPKKRK